MIYKLHLIGIIPCILGIVIFTVRSLWLIIEYKRKENRYHKMLMTKIEAMNFMINSRRHVDAIIAIFLKNILIAIVLGILLWVIW